MNNSYSDYFWENGKPLGIGKAHSVSKEFFRIISDPYHKRYSVESFREGAFHSTVYDSALLDFRKINPQNQAAWQRTVLDEGDRYQKCLIQDMDHRSILIEKLFYDGSRCIQCDIYSPHGLYLAKQRILFKDSGAPFNGVVLEDRWRKTVMCKKYSLGSDGEFDQLLEENWKGLELSHIDAPA